MSCCKGYYSTCKRCGFTGCDSCQVRSSYCFSCEDIVATEKETVEQKKEIDRLRERNQELKKLLKKHRITYEHSEDSSSDYGDYDIDNDPDCKIQ